MVVVLQLNELCGERELCFSDALSYSGNYVTVDVAVFNNGDNFFMPNPDTQQLHFVINVFAILGLKYRSKDRRRSTSY